MTKRIAASAPFLFCAVLTAGASANPGGQNFSWSFQTTSLNTSSTYQVAAAMRNGEAWPVVITDYSGSYGAAATLFPTSGSPGTPGSTWQNIGVGFFSGTSSIGRLRAATSPDGRVAFAASSSSSPSYVGMGGRVSSVTGGWGALPADTKAVAFDSHGNLYTASSTAVSGVSGYSGSTIADMDVSPTGEIGVVSSDFKFWQYSNWTGAWSSIALPGSPPPASDSLDLAYDSFGRPHVVATVGNAIVAYDFSTVSGSWSSTPLTTGINSSGTHVTLAANDDGTVGTSWIDSTGSLVYAYKHDLDSWASATVTNVGSFPPSPSQVGIAYDYAGLPVLAYRPTTGSNNIMVAYDPVVVPEPAGLTLLGLAAAATLARRRTRRA